MKPEPFWLSLYDVIAIHERSLVEHGGSAGLRDETMLHSALARPQHRWHYEAASLFDVAASYAFAIARNHPFIDGNKPTAFVSAYTFLALNGQQLVATVVSAALEVLALAAGERTETEIAQWLTANCKPIEAEH